MKKLALFSVALVALLAVSCKQHEPNEEIAASEETVENTVSAGNPPAVSSGSKRKFIRTADLRLKVKDVAESTAKIEETVKLAGGFVALSELRSDVRDTKEAKKSQDSIVRTTFYTVYNTIALRIPNQNLDETLSAIASQAAYIDYRIVKAEDVNLMLKSSELERNRLANYRKRLESASDSKGKKLADITSTEKDLLDKQQMSDSALVKQMELDDKVEYAAVALQLYQDEQSKSTVMANLDSDNFRTGFGTRAWDSVVSGWRIFEAIIVFGLNLWPFAVVAFGVYFGWKRFGKPKVTV